MGRKGKGRGAGRGKVNSGGGANANRPGANSQETPQNQQLPVQSQPPPQKQQQTQAQLQQPTPQKHQTPPQRQEQPAQNQQNPSQRQQPAQNQQPPPQRQQPAQNQQPPPQRQQPGQNQQPPPQRQQPAQNHQPPPQRQQPGQNQQPPPQRQQPAQNQQPPPQKQQPAQIQQPPPQRQQPAQNQQPPPQKQQPAQNQQPPPQRQQPPSQQQQPTRNGQQLPPKNSVIELPKRPDYGKAGKKVKLDVNFYGLKIAPNTIIHQYDVVISDGKKTDEFPKFLGRRLLDHFVKSNSRVFKTRPVFDGKKTLCIKEPLDFDGAKEFTVEYTEEDSRKREFKITLKWVGQLDMNVLQQVIQGRKDSIPQNIYQGLDLVLRHASSLRYVPVGSKFFQDNGAVNLGGGREMWPGYIVTVRPTGRWKLMLNVDTSATAFYRHIHVMQFLQEVFPRLDPRRELTDADRKRFEKEIKGLKIQITYMGNQKRKYRVNGLTKKSAAKQTFELDNKQKITVQEYFRKEKEVNLRFPNLNCLHVGNKDKNIYIPMEVCVMVPGQRCVKRLTDEQTAQMIRNTAKKPHERKRAIDDIVHQTAAYKNDPYVQDFGISVDTRMAEVDARVLDPPPIEYQNKGAPLIPSLGAWNMKGKKLYQPANINAWGLLVCNFGRPFPQDAASKFAQELQRSANMVGINMGRPLFQRAINKESENPSQIIADAIKQDPKFDLLVVILPGKTTFYANLKRMCETENGYTEATNDMVKKFLKAKGLSTQCIQAKNALKCNAMTLAQLCLKINSKMGGVNNIISNQNNQVTRPIRVFKEPVMFMGADVTHPGIGDKESPSIAAIVGSIDPFPSKYAVCVKVQKHRVEMIEEMKEVTKDLLKQFYAATRTKPCKIIMYRDGVSEGQFQQVLQHEMRAIQQACTELQSGYQPGITFIVVQKRHHARFFPKNRDEQDRSGNCLPGTTIDTGVCHPVEYDYYQYSHSGIQGTSRPSHYHVLWDDNNLRSDELQALSFMLCHLYVRCTRSVSIPAPAYYAHHVAFRAKDHLSSQEFGSSSSGGQSDVSSVTKKMENLSLKLKGMVKPHPNLQSRMYFV